MDWRRRQRLSQNGNQKKEREKIARPQSFFKTLQKEVPYFRFCLTANVCTVRKNKINAKMSAGKRGIWCVCVWVQIATYLPSSQPRLCSSSSPRPFPSQAPFPVHWWQKLEIRTLFPVEGCRWRRPESQVAGRASSSTLIRRRLQIDICR